MLSTIDTKLIFRDFLEYLWRARACSPVFTALGDATGFAMDQPEAGAMLSDLRVLFPGRAGGGGETGIAILRPGFGFEADPALADLFDRVDRLVLVGRAEPANTGRVEEIRRRLSDGDAIWIEGNEDVICLTIEKLPRAGTSRLLGIDRRHMKNLLANTLDPARWEGSATLSAQGGALAVGDDQTHGPAYVERHVDLPGTGLYFCGATLRPGSSAVVMLNIFNIAGLDVGVVVDLNDLAACCYNGRHVIRLELMRDRWVDVGWLGRLSDFHEAKIKLFPAWAHMASPVFQVSIRGDVWLGGLDVSLVASGQHEDQVVA